MKTVITIEDGKVTVEVDDKAPVVVNNSPPAAPLLKAPTGPINQKPSKISPGNPASRPTRTCEICDGPIPAGTHALAKVCSDKCRDEKRRRYQTANHKKAEPKPRPAVDETPSPPLPMPPITPPLKHRTDDEQAEIEAVMDEQRKNFSDPWGCGMCRNAGDLCTMHEQMTRDGKKPPVGRGIQT